MQVAVHQPGYWPWPRYVHKVMSADVFVYLDCVQFSKNGVQNRNKIKTPGGPRWLTLPVRHPLGQSILEVRIADMTALEKHWRTLSVHYGGTSGFRLWMHELEGLLRRIGNDSLCEVAIATTEWMLEKLGVTTRRMRASQLPGVGGQGSRLIASICRALGARRYLSGVGAIDYMSLADFAAEDCEVWVQQWGGCHYPQAHPAAGFVADLSTLDLLLNCPLDARGVIEAAGNWTELWSRT